MKIRVAHSPDSDDYFLFWALRERRLPWGEFEFEFETHDTAVLNSLARDGVPDIVAISAAAFPEASPNYRIMSSGASVGRGFGPQLVSIKEVSDAELRVATVGVPGRTTTAGLVVSNLLPSANLVEIPITPFELVFEALSDGSVDAAVLIHEGQMVVGQRGLRSLYDLGVFWQEKHALPLPLGLNCVRHNLGPAVTIALDKIAQASVVYAQEHFADVLPYLCSINRTRQAGVVTPEGITEYLHRYANHDSVRLNSDVIEGLRILLSAKAFILADEHFVQS